MRGTRSRLTGLTALALLTTALAGCGGSGDSEKPAATTAANATADNTAVKQVMTDLQTASRAGDGKRICTQIFTPKLANSVTASAKSGSCAKEVRKKLFSRKAQIAVQNVDLPNAANATAVIKEANGNTSTIFLVKQSGRWRIRSVSPA
jgi:predicted small lipoprotein YifL